MTPAEAIHTPLQQTTLTQWQELQATGHDHLARHGVQIQNRVVPYDPWPRVIHAADWDRLCAGISQRHQAINCFVADVYSRQLILQDGVISRQEIEESPLWQPDLQGLFAPDHCWCLINGLDLIGGSQQGWRVLEDNLRRVGGHGYAVGIREASSAAGLVKNAAHQPRPVLQGLQQLRAALHQLCPHQDDPLIVLLTPSTVSTEISEHRFLAAAMGIALARPEDLHCDQNQVFLLQHGQKLPVDVIYRRNEDRIGMEPDGSSAWLGVPGLKRVAAEGNVQIANLPGAGIGSDKALYRHVGAMIRYYLGEEALIEQVPTFSCRDPKELEHVLHHLTQLVVKPVDGAGGLDMLHGPTASAAECAAMSASLQAQPERFIAQPAQVLHTLPTLVGERLQPCAVDLRPVSLLGDTPQVLPGALTRVAPPGSSIVNLNRGGSLKDTWILDVAA